jgi:methionyl-tRNA formyltransferase
MVRIVFMGTPEFATPALRHLVLNDYQVAAVYTQPDRLAGRGRGLAISPVKKVAWAAGIPVFQPVSLKRAEAVAELAGLKPDVIVVAAYGKILPESVLKLPGYGCINIHPSLLPRHRGASPIAAAILNGDRFTGTSIMLMDKGLDTGPVLKRAQIPITDRDSTGSLTRKLALVSSYLLQDVLCDWLRGEITPQPQDEASATCYGTITKEDGEIDWCLPSAVIWRRVRAYNPWPGAYTRWQGKLLKIIEAEPLPVAGDTVAGKVVPLPGDGFGIGAGDAILMVRYLQLEGKKIMTAGEFLRGQRQFAGAVLPG